jgi:transposase
MILIFLSNVERTRLHNLLQTTECAKTYRRAQAILWLDEGVKVQEIAQQLQVTRFTVSNWRSRFLQRRSLPANQWFRDDPHPGRPRKGDGRIEHLLDEVIDKDPRDWGYQSTTWTAPLLAQYLQEFHQIEVVPRTVGRVLERLNICWKRPRHDLASRAQNWRQAKGGSNVA